MPDSDFFGPALTAAVAAGSVSEARVDDMVMRWLVPAVVYGLFENTPNASRNLQANVTSDAHNALARQLAEQSITLLQNENNVLPINPSRVASIAVFGDETSVHGFGSGGVNAP
jgi:beta-glucosidase